MRQIIVCVEKMCYNHIVYMFIAEVNLMTDGLIFPSAADRTAVKYTVISADGRYAFSFGTVRVRSVLTATASLTDFTTREKLVFREPSRVSAKVMGTFTASDTQLTYTSDYCDFRVSSTDFGVHLDCVYKKCFFHSEMEAHADVYSSAYVYGAGDTRVNLCCPFSGQVKVCGREYAFDRQKELCTALKTSGGDFRSHTGTRIYACGYAEEDAFGLYLADGEGICVFGGGEFSLRDANILVPADAMSKWTVRSEGDAVKAELAPFFNDRTDRGHFSFPRYSDGLYCSLKGALSPSSGLCAQLDGMTAFCEYTHKKF